MVVLGRAWDALKNAVDGLKTLCVSAMFLALVLADYYDAVNIRPVLESVFGADRATKIAVLMPIVFGTLRFLSNGPVKWSKLWREEKTEAADGPDDIRKGQ